MVSAGEEIGPATSVETEEDVQEAQRNEEREAARIADAAFDAGADRSCRRSSNRWSSSARRRRLSCRSRRRTPVPTRHPWWTRRRK